MPTYEYVCDACEHAFEEFQSITAKPLRQCPVCAKNKLRRLIGTGAGVIFKGSGFYETDYRSDSYKSAAKADTPSPGTPGTPGTPKTSENSGTSRKSAPVGAKGATPPSAGGDKAATTKTPAAAPAGKIETAGT